MTLSIFFLWKKEIGLEQFDVPSDSSFLLSLPFLPLPSLCSLRLLKCDIQTVCLSLGFSDQSNRMPVNAIPPLPPGNTFIFPA